MTSRASFIRSLFAVYFLAFVAWIIPLHDRHHTNLTGSSSAVLGHQQGALSSAQDNDLCLLCKNHSPLENAPDLALTGHRVEATSAPAIRITLVASLLLPSDLSPRAPPLAS